MAVTDQPSSGSIPLSEFEPVEPDSSLLMNEQQSAWRYWLTAFFGMLFAFLLASFPAQNSDLWSHLTAGRNLLKTGAFTSTIANLNIEPRSRQFLLYDLVVYGLYSTLGGSGLVFAKALMVAGIAFMMMRVSRSGRDYGWAIGCTILAMLVMAVRLPLQPSTVSCFLLAVTLLFLRNKPSADRAVPLLPPWPLLLVFVIWANIDSWFLIGLAVVALVWLGEIVDEQVFAGRRLQSLGRRLVSIALLALVCLLNPIHIHAFGLPPEMAAGQMASPFRRAYFSAIARIPAGLAYYLLLGLCLLSFALNLRGWRWQRFLPWFAVAALSAVQIRAIPFFAVLAGPVLAWNIQEIVAWRFKSANWDEFRWRFAQAIVRPFIMLAGVALLVAVWPGWLQFPPFEPRRWAIDLPPSLQSGTATVNRLRAEGMLPLDTRWLHLTSDTTFVFTWFCPDETHLYDAQLTAVIRGESNDPDFAKRMRTAGINRVVVFGSDRPHQATALRNMLNDPVQWPLLNVDGELAIFGWRDPAESKSADQFRDLTLDLERRAFHPADDQKAPSKPPERQAVPRHWWEALWKRSARPTLDGEEAKFHFFHAELFRRPAPVRHMVAWELSQSAAIIASSAGWSGPGGLFDARVRLSLLRPELPEPSTALKNMWWPDVAGLQLQDWFARNSDDTPPALLYLAIRAARRAIHANPQDAESYLLLGESYYRLLHSTQERAWTLRFGELKQLRYVQISAALNQAILLNPSLADAHLRLSELYREMNCLDLTLKHLRIYYDLVQRSIRLRGQINEQFREQEAQYVKEIERLSKHLEQQRKSFSAGAAKAKLLERVKAAEGMGLAEQARDMLLASDISAFDAEGAIKELELLLKTGRYREVRDWVTPDEMPILGPSTYHLIRAQASAAAGDYVEAELECDRLAQTVSYESTGKEPISLPHVIALLVGRTMLEEHPGMTPIPMLAYRAYLRFDFHEQITSLVRRMQKEADATVLRGMLALEEGEVSEARFAFRTALAIWNGERAKASGTAVDFNSRPAAEQCLKWLK